jgi:hypothetical protein
MANAYAQNPIYVDTAFQSYKGQVAATLGTLFTLVVTKIRWVGPASVGDQVVIDDPQGGVQLAFLRNTVAGGPDIEEDYSASPRLWRDFSVAQISSGKLFIHTK